MLGGLCSIIWFLIYWHCLQCLQCHQVPGYNQRPLHRLSWLRVYLARVMIVKKLMTDWITGQHWHLSATLVSCVLTPVSFRLLMVQPLPLYFFNQQMKRSECPLKECWSDPMTCGSICSIDLVLSLFPLQLRPSKPSSHLMFLPGPERVGFLFFFSWVVHVCWEEQNIFPDLAVNEENSINGNYFIFYKSYIVLIWTSLSHVPSLFFKHVKTLSI